MIINTESDNAKLLVNALKANGTFSQLSGLLMLSLQNRLSQWFGQIEPLIFAACVTISVPSSPAQRNVPRLSPLETIAPAVPTVVLRE